jgi:hypothetical protein
VQLHQESAEPDEDSPERQGAEDAVEDAVLIAGRHPK